MESNEILEYTDFGHTAKCPKCGIDSIIPDSIGAEIDDELLADMNAYWF